MSKSNKLGYLQLDVMFAGLLFFLFFSVIFTQTTNLLSNRSDQLEMFKLKSTSKDLCKIYSQTSLGLKNDITKQLDTTKLSSLTNDNYITEKTKFGLDKYNFHLNIVNSQTSSELLDFGFSSPSNSLSSVYTCYLAHQNITQILTLEVWK